MKTVQAMMANEESFSRFVGISVIAHLSLVIIFTLKAIFFSGEPIEYQAAVRVDLIGLPDKIQAQPTNEPVKPEVAKPPAPKEPPAPEATVAKKPLPPKAVVDPDAINLDRNKAKQKEAMNKLKQMSAFDKIQQELEEQNNKKAAAAAQKPIKGNQVSAGSQLTGLAKIQAEDYIGTVERQIRQNWTLPQWLSKKNLKAQIRVRFDEKGNLLFAQIVKSSGNPAFDEYVVDTVRKSAPLPPPPDKFVRLMNLEGILFGFPE